MTVRFNTQPPEGGWTGRLAFLTTLFSFNTQPPEGGCNAKDRKAALKIVSTHSRLKAAGRLLRFLTFKERCFNTQPPEGGCTCYSDQGTALKVSTHSRLKAAGTRRLHFF